MLIFKLRSILSLSFSVGLALLNGTSFCSQNSTQSSPPTLDKIRNLTFLLIAEHISNWSAHQAEFESHFDLKSYNHQIALLLLKTKKLTITNPKTEACHLHIQKLGAPKHKICPSLGFKQLAMKQENWSPIWNHFFKIVFVETDFNEFF